MDQVLASACMVLSGSTSVIKKGTALHVLSSVFRDKDISSSNFFAAATSDPESTISQAMAGQSTKGHKLPNQKAVSAWNNFRWATLATVGIKPSG